MAAHTTCFVLIFSRNVAATLARVAAALSKLLFVHRCYAATFTAISRDCFAVVPGGFEPPLREPKTLVLPLHHRTVPCAYTLVSPKPSVQPAICHKRMQKYTFILI